MNQDGARATNGPTATAPVGAAALGSLRALVDDLPTAAALVEDEQLRINACVERLTGYTRNELRTVADWFTKLCGRLAQRCRERYELDRAAGFPTPAVIQILCRDGTPRLCEFVAHREDTHELWLLHDVTQGQLAEERFRILFERSSGPHLLLDEVAILDCNDATVRLLRAESKAEVMALHPSALSPEFQPDGQRSIDKWIVASSIARERGSHQLQWLHRRLDGELFVADVSMTSVVIDREPVLLTLWHDVTEQQRTAAELRRARDAAEATVQAKTEFMARMSHELRTPMNAILGLAGLLDSTTLSEQQSEFLETIRDSAKALRDAIDRVLDFSNIESGRVDLESIEFDPRDPIEEAVLACAPAAQAKGLELTCSFDAHLPLRRRGDPYRLRQVLANLLDNAIKFTPEGHVAVEVHCDGELAGTSVIRVEVRDSGIGIPLAAQERLFDAFSRVDSSTTRATGGTGLGLAICRGLAELMGGTTGVDSAPGQGSRFWFTVALSAPTDDSPPMSREPIAPPVRILIVDDSERSIEVLERQLQHLGATVETALSAEQGLAWLLSAHADGAPFDAALVDSRLHDRDGRTFVTRLRELPELVGTRTILLTPLAGRDESRPRGTIRLTKPVLPRHLRAALAALRTPVDEAATTHRDPASTRVLVAEDNPINRRVALHMLRKLGYEPDLVHNGVEAVQAATRNDYDVVLMDCQMPEMDGYDATRAIRRLANVRQPRILALTANAIPGERERCLAAGMDDYLSKPVVLEDMATILARWS